MINVPVLITAYNRPEKVLALLESLRQSEPKLIYFSVDGPKKHKKMDLTKTKQVAAAVSVIDWDCDIRTRFRETNLGIRKAIPDAVSWVLSEHDRVIVLEEDIIVGPQALDFGSAMLSRFENSGEIGHISLYNVVPRHKLSEIDAQIRLSIYPESIAWATWRRAWDGYDDNLMWGTRSKISEIARQTGNFIGAFQWKLNFQDAKKLRISTWAYRWIASLWSRKQYVLSPNVNLVTYDGLDEGSHTLTRPPWVELEIGTLDSKFDFDEPTLDLKAEDWVAKKIFKETVFGLFMHLTIILIRTIVREKH